jgi:hypothetical protein
MPRTTIEDGAKILRGMRHNQALLQLRRQALAQYDNKDKKRMKPAPMMSQKKGQATLACPFNLPDSRPRRGRSDYQRFPPP